MGVNIDFIGTDVNASSQMAQIRQRIQELTERTDRWNKISQAGANKTSESLQRINKEVTDLVRIYSTLEERQNRLQKGISQTGDITQGMSRRSSMAFAQISYSIQDVSAVAGTMGLAGSIRSIGDNAVFAANQFNPLLGLATAFGVAIATYFSGGIRKTEQLKTGLEGMKKTLKDYIDMVKERQELETPEASRATQKALAENEKQIQEAKKAATNLEEIIKEQTVMGKAVTLSRDIKSREKLGDPWLTRKAAETGGLLSIASGDIAESFRHAFGYQTFTEQKVQELQVQRTRIANMEMEKNKIQKELVAKEERDRTRAGFKMKGFTVEEAREAAQEARNVYTAAKVTAEEKLQPHQKMPIAEKVRLEGLENVAKKLDIIADTMARNLQKEERTFERKDLQRQLVAPEAQQ